MIGATVKSRVATSPCWLRDFLPQAKLGLRILAYYHNSKWESGALTMSLREYGEELLTALESVRRTKEV
jgi:hypothetical protein